MCIFNKMGAPVGIAVTALSLILSSSFAQAGPIGAEGLIVPPAEPGAAAAPAEQAKPLPPLTDEQLDKLVLPFPEKLLLQLAQQGVLEMPDVSKLLKKHGLDLSELIPVACGENELETDPESEEKSVESVCVLAAWGADSVKAPLKSQLLEVNYSDGSREVFQIIGTKPTGGEIAPIDTGPIPEFAFEILEDLELTNRKIEQKVAHVVILVDEMEPGAIKKPKGLRSVTPEEAEESEGQVQAPKAQFEVPQSAIVIQEEYKEFQKKQAELQAELIQILARQAKRKLVEGGKIPDPRVKPAPKAEKAPVEEAEIK